MMSRVCGGDFIFQLHLSWAYEKECGAILNQRRAHKSRDASKIVDYDTPTGRDALSQRHVEGCREAWQRSRKAA
jgi:hypothetical protein